MGLLDDDLQTLFANVFSPTLLPGTLHVPETTPDGHGGYATTFPAGSAKAIRGMVDDYSEGYRVLNAIPRTDVRLLVLQSGVAASPDTEHEITLRGQRYRIVNVTQDVAQAAWVFQGRAV